MIGLDVRSSRETENLERDLTAATSLASSPGAYYVYWRVREPQ